MIYILAALILYTIAILLATAAVRAANFTLVSAVQSILAAVVPVALVIPSIAKKSIQDQRIGLVYAALAGICIALFTLAINKSYEVNRVGIVTPIIFGGAIFLSTILSFFIFKERISPLQAVGLFLLAAGFLIIIYARAMSK